MHKLYLNKALNAFFAVLLVACSAPETTYNDLTIDQVLLPIILVDDITKVPLSALSVEQALFIDSVRCADYQVSLKDDTLTVRGANQKGLTVLHLYDRDIRYSTVIQDLRYSKNPASNKIKCTDATRQSIAFELKGAKEVMVFWNNLELVTEGTHGHFSAFLPPFAKYKDFAHVLIYGVDSAGYVYSRVLPLLKGKLVRDLNKMRQPMVKDALALSHLHLSLGLTGINKQRYGLLLDDLKRDLIDEPKHIAAVYGRFELEEADSLHRSYLAEYMDVHCRLVFNTDTLEYHWINKGKESRMDVQEASIDALSTAVILSQ